MLDFTYKFIQVIVLAILNFIFFFFLWIFGGKDGERYNAVIKMSFLFIFLYFLVIQTEGWISFGLPCNLGMQLSEVLNYKVSNFLFELPWKYS